jgi:hypothetical protein
MYSPPLMLLTAMWVFFFIKDAVRKRLQTRDWLVLMLFGYGFLHNLAFPNLVWHDYLAVCYVPGIAVAGSVASIRFGQQVENTWGVKARNVALAVFLAITVTTSLYITRRLYAGDEDHSVRLKRWGEIIRNHSHESDTVLAPTSTDRVFQYYVEREMEFGIDTPQKFSKSKEQENRTIFIVPARQLDKYRDVLADLNGKYSRRDEDGLVLYLLQK